MSSLDDANKAADILIAEALKIKQQRDELLAALLEIEDHHNETEDWREIARSAIKKAKGL